MKNPLYRTAVTFGRFNIPHFSHVELVEKMLEQAETAHVYLSVSASNTDWDTRSLLFRHLLRERGVDLSRVELLKSDGPFTAVETTLETDTDLVVVLGEDQSALCERLCATFDLGGQLNRRTGSSTQVRHLLDQGDDKGVAKVYRNDIYSIRLATILRKEELRREKSRVA